MRGVRPIGRGSFCGWRRSQRHEEIGTIDGVVTCGAGLLAVGRRFVENILNLRPFFRDTFQIFSALGPNFQISRRSKSGLFFLKKSKFLQPADAQSLTNRQSPRTPPKGVRGHPVRAPRGCNGAAIALQRGACCNMTACSLRCNKGLIARRNPLFDLFWAIKNSRTFSKFKSRKALKASPGLPQGEESAASQPSS